MIQKPEKFKREAKKSLFFSTFLGLLVFAVIGILIVSNWKIYQRRLELNSRIEALRKEIEVLEKKNQELKAGISQVGTEDYSEKVAREELGLKKPGEEVVVIKKEKEEETKKEEKSFWNFQNWLEWIKSQLRD